MTVKPIASKALRDYALDDKNKPNGTDSEMYRKAFEKKPLWMLEDKDILYNADPNCEHEIYGASGGGIKCKKCPGWFCY